MSIGTSTEQPSTLCGIQKPLQGIRVVDFTRVLAGPYCTALLADLGAQVIKVEPPQGDDYRAIGPMREGRSALFEVMNRNKHSVVLDLKLPQAQALAQQLCASADVVVENFRPGVADKLGIGPTQLRAQHPQLIYVSISGFGQTGPAAHRPAYDIIMQALSGLMEATGSPEGPPTLVGEAVSDVVSGLYASWATLAALLARERTGQGTHVDVAMLDATLALTVTSVARFLFTGRNPVRVGNRHPLSAPFGVYRAQDGHFVLAVLNTKLFGQLCDHMGCPQLAQDPRFGSDEARAEHEPALREHIERWASAYTVSTITAGLEAAHIPAAPICTVEQALSSPQALHREVIRPVAQEQLPGLQLPSQPVKFSQWPSTDPHRAPTLGEHTADLMSSLLGLSAQRLAELHALGVFGTQPRPTSDQDRSS